MFKIPIIMTKKTENKKNLLKLAKTKKGSDDESQEKTLDIEAKERIEKLLDDVDVNEESKNDDLFEIDYQKKGDNDWLQDELKRLSEENEKLRYENVEAKESYKKIFDQYQSLKSGGNVSSDKDPKLVPDSVLKNYITNLFMEFQNNLIGRNPERRKYKQINLPHLIAKMVQAFPFLNELKRV